MTRVLAAPRRLLVLAGLASLCLGSAAQAQPRTQTTPLGRYGAWTVYAMVTPAGRDVCGMVASGAEGRRLHIQHVRNTNFILFQAHKASWTIPQGTRMQINMRIDQGAGWTAPQATGQGRSAHWTLRSGLSRFEAEFRNGSRLTLTFPQGNEPEWSVSLNGSSEAMARLVTCMRSHGNEPTQPFGGAPTPPGQPSQPFSAPAPSGPPSGPPGPDVPPGKAAPATQAPPLRGQPIGF
ncbi:hypothetical protein [Roseococcus suduntuyensis]|uniref:Invasion protein IalB n=1 Tax=Roseococcus suduntuyensis TaxID=455361 RepID=A0A840A737_9PROT|nr:hypothetical protein [Roseococcus suduntuyensis]MBB3896682.1 invasion protein IalB [Roseococcus suduntuyensis]